MRRLASAVFNETRECVHNRWAGSDPSSYLLDPGGIPHNRCGPGIEGCVEPDTLGDRCWPDCVKRSLQRGQYVHGSDVQSHVPRDHTGDIKQVLDELDLDRRVAQDRLSRLPHRHRVKAALQHPSPPIDGIEGSPQLIGERGEELILAAIEHLGLHARCLLTLQEGLASLFDEALR